MRALRAASILANIARVFRIMLYRLHAIFKYVITTVSFCISNTWVFAWSCVCQCFLSSWELNSFETRNDVLRGMSVSIAGRPSFGRCGSIDLNFLELEACSIPAKTNETSIRSFDNIIRLHGAEIFHFVLCRLETIAKWHCRVDWKKKVKNWKSNDYCEVDFFEI